MPGSYIFLRTYFVQTNTSISRIGFITEITEPNDWGHPAIEHKFFRYFSNVYFLCLKNYLANFWIMNSGFYYRAFNSASARDWA